MLVMVHVNVSSDCVPLIEAHALSIVSVTSEVSLSYHPFVVTDITS